MNITIIEGIGPVNANRLREQGITTTGGMLDAAKDAQGRRELSQATGLSAELILEWVNRADLMRINGVGEEYSDLLEQAGVDTVKELRRRNPENLHKALLATNDDKHRVRRPPSLNIVKRWIEEAKELSIEITY